MSALNNQIRALDHEGGKGMSQEERLAKKHELAMRKAELAKQAMTIYHRVM